jgi:hypothetical protein
MGISGLWLGQIELLDGHARLPRRGYFPSCLLPLHEVPLTRVCRWGSGTGDDTVAALGVLGGVVGAALAAAAFRTPRMLMFEIKTARGTAVRRIFLGACTERQAKAIYHYFQHNLGEPLQLTRHRLWGLRFADRAPARSSGSRI